MGLLIQGITEKNDEEVINGCIKCECSEFPVIEGILNLKIGPLNRIVVRLIKERRISEALILCFGWEDFENLHRSYTPFRSLGRIHWLGGLRLCFTLNNSKQKEKISTSSLVGTAILGKSPSDIYLN